MPTTIEQMQKLARLIRYYILISTTAAGSGHATSSLSAVELATVLFFKYLRADLENPNNLANDRFIMSKGHASPLFYALYGAAGKVSEEELKNLRKFHSVLEGHPSMRFPYTEVPTGSLGQGLSVGVGEALALRMHYSSSEPQANREVTNESSRLRSNNNLPMVYVLLGDGEMAEGQNWEAIQLATHYKLNNLIAIIDVNRLGQSGQTMYGVDAGAFAKRVASFGWRTYVVEDGHDLGLVDKAYQLALEQSKTSQMPAAIIARTVKGKGISFLEDKEGLHGIALKPDEMDKALKELGEVDRRVRGAVQKPQQGVISSAVRNPDGDLSLTTFVRDDKNSFSVYKSNDKVATRKAYGTGLVRLGKMYENVVVLDGEVKNSTYSELFLKTFPDRFFEMFIAEQNMVSAALGMAKLGLVPFISSFGCFLARAADSLRMADLSGLHLVVCGSHAGVSIGEDGPTQMALSDLALLRSLFNSIVLYSSDAVMTERLVEEAYNAAGIVYLRTTRPATPILYKPDERFEVGGSKVFYSSSEGATRLSREVLDSPTARSNNKEITVVAAGITVFEALQAQTDLAKENIAVRVIDCYSIKPIDVVTLKKAASETRAIITVEDHYAVGGLGDAVLEALSGESHIPVHKLAVTKTPRSGTSQELLAFEEIDAAAIVKKVKSIQN